MERLVNFVMLILLTIIYLSGSISMVESWLHLSDPLLALSCIGIILVYLLTIKKNSSISVLILSIFFLFILFNLFSSLINSSAQTLLSTFRYILVFLTLTIFTPLILKQKIFSISIYALLLGHIPLILISVKEQNPFITNSSMYMGIFYNPNSFGLIVATIYVVLLSVFFNAKNKVFKSFIITGLLTLFILIIYSNSRTSFSAVIAITIISFLIRMIGYTKQEGLNFRKISYYITSFTLIATTSYIFTKTKYYKLLEMNILNKFIRKINAGDILDQRGDLWSKTLIDINLFGHGPNYFTNTYGIGSHNSFISIIGQSGAIVGFLFIVIWIIAIVKSITYFIKNIGTDYNLLPFLIISLFILGSMTEVMLMKASMLLSLVVFGAIIRQDFIDNTENLIG